MKRGILYAIEKNFGFWMLIMSAVSYMFPNMFMWGHEHTDKLLMFSFFLGCLRIDIEEVVHLKSNYGKLIMFTGLNLLLLPVIVYFITPYFDLETRQGIFLIMATAGGMLTPLIASFLRLNVLWAVVYVVLTSTLVPFTLPGLVELLFGVKMDISGIEMIVFLSKIVFPPAILAFLVRRYTPKFSLGMQKYAGALGGINMSIFIAILIAHNSDFLHANLFCLSNIPVMLILVCIFVVRYFLGFVMPAKNKNERWSNALLFGVMNNGLVMLFAAEYFSEQVLFVTLLSEIPWILAQPIFQRLHQRFYAE